MKIYRYNIHRHDIVVECLPLVVHLKLASKPKNEEKVATHIHIFQDKRHLEHYTVIS